MLFNMNITNSVCLLFILLMFFVSMFIAKVTVGLSLLEFLKPADIVLDRLQVETCVLHKLQELWLELRSFFSRIFQRKRKELFQNCTISAPNSVFYVTKILHHLMKRCFCTDNSLNNVLSWYCFSFWK